MTFDDLREQWQESNAQATNQQLREEALVRVCRGAERIKAKVLSRDIIETVAAIGAFLFFGIAIFNMPSLMARIGTAIILVWCVQVVWRLHHTRLKGRMTKIDLTVCQYYQREVEDVERQIAMLRNILWWYVLPGFVGVNLVFSGLSASLLVSGVYFVVTLLFCGGVVWLNHRAVRITFLPLRKEINALLDELNETPSE